MKTPTLTQIKKHFSKAKEIRCLKSNTIIGVSHVTDFSWNEEEQSWNGPAGIVTFWRNGQYAEITKKKCGAGCNGCKPCEEKRKNLKK